MIDVKILEDETRIKLKGFPSNLLYELQLLNLRVLEELEKFSNTTTEELAEEMSQILMKTIRERSGKQ